MNKLLLLLIYILIGSNAFGQWYDPDKVDKKAATLFNLAYNNAQNGNYEHAKKLLGESIKIEPRFVDAYLSMAGVLGEEKKYDSAAAYYEKAFALDTAYSNYYLLPYSINLAGEGKFGPALQAVDQFLKIQNLNERSTQAGNFRKKTYQFALDMAAKRNKEYIFTPVNLGDSINTKDLEYFPTLTIDGKKLIFTRRIGNNEDFYISEKLKDGWSSALPLPGNINSQEYNEGAETISQDGRWLIFTGCNFPEGLGSCDLYISYLTKTGWSKPQNLGRQINTEFWESTPSLSPDKRALYFSSNRPGGYGGKDIWVSYRDEKGNWGVPYNLGPDINTSGDESTPFIHADNQTLYFNSTGLPGYSEKPDLFVTRKQADGGWGKPENLGYPINTIDDEGSLFIAADGHTAYYSSDKNDTRGGLDIYTFELPEEVRPLKTLWVQGKVFDKKTTEGLPSLVELTELESGNTVSKLQTDEDGEFLVTLPVGNDYAFTVRRKGYLFYSENYNISHTAPDSTFTANIALQPIEKDASIILKNIFFDTKKTELRAESIVELKNIVSLLKDNPTVRIQIIGYTDNVGKPADNLALSKGRAVAVVNYLIGQEIAPERLTFEGKGEANPIATNTTEEGRAQNRRTELKVVSK